MEVFLVYLWLKLPDIIIVSGMGAFVSSVLFVLTQITKTKTIYTLTFAEWIVTEEGKRYRDRLYSKDYYASECPKEYKTVSLWEAPFKRFYLLPLILWVVFITIPTQTQTAVLVGTSIAVDVAKSPEGAKVGQLLRKKANELLDAELAKVTK